MNSAIKSPFVREMLNNMPRYTVCKDSVENTVTPEQAAIDEAMCEHRKLMDSMRTKKQKQDADRQRRKTHRESQVDRYYMFFESTGNSHGFILNGVTAANLHGGMLKAIERHPQMKEKILRDYFVQFKNITQEKDKTNT